MGICFVDWKLMTTISQWGQNGWGEVGSVPQLPYLEILFVFVFETCFLWVALVVLELVL